MALLQALMAPGINPLPVFVTSLKDPLAVENAPDESSTLRRRSTTSIAVVAKA